MGFFLGRSPLSEQTRVLEQAVETELSQAVASLKAKTAAQATETDAAQAMLFVSLAWDANPVGENITDYKLYYGNASGVYNGALSPISMGTETTYLFVPGQTGTIYMAITAVNAQDESTFSNEVSKTL